MLTIQARAAAQAPEPDITETIDPSAPSTPAEPDVTETIEPDGPAEKTALAPAPTAASAAAPPPAPLLAPVAAPAAAPASEAGQDRLSLSGWARESLELTFSDAGLRAVAVDSLRVPRERFTSRTQLLVRSSLQRGRSFEAQLSGLLGMDSYVPASEGSDSQLGVRERYDAQLREAYLGFFWSDFDLRLGQQRVAWGRADVMSPNDVLNARDLRDPFLSETEVRTIPTPMARGDLYQGPFVLELVVAPVFVPDRFTLYGTNWAAIQPNAPPEYRGFFHLLDQHFDASIRGEVSDALQQTRLPNRNGEGVSAGAKVGLSTEGVDCNLYYQYGYDGTPFVALDPSLTYLLRTTDFSTAGLADLEPVLRGADHGIESIWSEYVRRHHVGIDAAVPAGPFVFRLDAAYQTGRVFYRLRDLLSVTSPTLLAVVSAEYQTGNLDETLILEWIIVGLTSRVSEPLLSYEAPVSHGFAAVFRWPLVGDLGFSLRSAVGIAPFTWVVQPALELEVRPFLVRAGALVLDGERGSYGWYLHHDDTAFLQAKYSF